jgi:hypothetical protein
LGSVFILMVADWSAVTSATAQESASFKGFGTGPRVMRVIRGDIGATGAFNATVVFTPQHEAK